VPLTGTGPASTAAIIIAAAITAAAAAAAYTPARIRTGDTSVPRARALTIASAGDVAVHIPLFSPRVLVRVLLGETFPAVLVR
jgi:hypothetical protein